MTLRHLVAGAVLLSATVARADEALVSAPLPAMTYAGTEATQAIFDALHSDPLFAKLNKELVGCPIVLRVTHSLEPTSGGKATGVTTALLAAGTLGLIPFVTNHDLVVDYEFLVNGSVAANYTYRKNFTYSKNLWTKDKTFGLGNDGLAWVKNTAPEALAAMRSDPKLAALVEEYRYYFGATTP